MKQRETTPSERATKALSGVTQGVRGHAVPAAVGMALLPLMPQIREMALASKNIPAGLKTETADQLHSLAERLVRAGGRDPDKGKKLILELMPDRGHAEMFSEWLGKGKRPTRDFLQLGLGVSPEAAAHEVGHLTGKSRAVKTLRTSAQLARTGPAKALPSLLALSAALGNKEELPVHAKAAPLLGAAQLATMLGEETRANLRGAKLLKAIGHAPSLARKLKMFLPTATYLGQAGLLVGAPIGILKGIEYYNKAKAQGTPIDAKKLWRHSPEQLAKTPPVKALQEKWQPKFETK